MLSRDLLVTEGALAVETSLSRSFSVRLESMRRQIHVTFFNTEQLCELELKDLCIQGLSF